MTLVYDKPNSRQNEPVADNTSITIGVFMDGTSNNSYNVIARNEHKKEYDKAQKEGKKDPKYSDKARAYDKYTGDDASYENDHTNVYRLYEAYQKTDRINKIYIEGIGTVYKEKEEKEFDHYGSDDMRDGSGYGMGINGIRGKVYKACEQAADLCTEDTRYLTIDVFGFSRGAAAARNLVYEVFRPDGLQHNIPPYLIYNDSIDELTYQQKTNLRYFKASRSVSKGGFFGYLLKKKGFDIQDLRIKIRFVGIFDTVASYDPKSLLFPEFEKYSKLLKMDEVTNIAKKIIHLTSENEHRINFALTPVRKTINVIEHCLPGVHSDVGGCYVDGTPEEKDIATKSVLGTTTLDERRDWLIRECFFMNGELTTDGDVLKSKRAKIGAKYARIPLAIMTKYGNMEIDGSMFNNSTSIENTLLNDSKLEMLEKRKDDVIKNIRYYLTIAKTRYLKNSNADAQKMESEFISEIDRLINIYAIRSDMKEVDDDELLFYARRVMLSSIFDPKDERGLEREGLVRKKGTDIVKNKILTVYAIENDITYYANAIIKQIVLLKLRNRHFHWSATYKKTFKIAKPHEPVARNDRPTENGIRLIYNA